ncbi:MAG: hypothetical protein M3041_04685 [Acidobacteriota bacterium]|nr:hypothetical protein [Acidobacteriota bacterium]
MTTAESVERQLLLNIARARNNQPIHFTAVSSIAATYRVTTSAGIGPALTGNRGGLGRDADGRTRFGTRSGAETIHKNRPSDRDGYQVFGRIVAHLSSIQDQHALNVEPLHFTHTWKVAEALVTPETYASTYKDFTISHDVAEHVYEVSRRINGRVMITNYDPDILSNEERLRLHQKAEEAPSNDILIDVRAGQVGGEFPIHGRLRLRSFHEVLTFIGRGISEEPEFDVAPDPRTRRISENPRNTLEISRAINRRRTDAWPCG